MYKISIDKFNNEFITKEKRSFYSLCRNVEEFCIDDEEKVNDTIEYVKSNFSSQKDSSYYDKTIIFLRRKITSMTITPDEASFILINSIDPNFRLYELYEEECNNDLFQKKAKIFFKFYDENFFKLEKKYVENKGIKDSLKWEYKKMD